jgi:hypothetical protein
MTYNDPYNPRPQPPPDAMPPEQIRLDMAISTAPVIGTPATFLVAVAALLVVIVLIIWAGPTDQQTASNPPATTGQGGQVPPRIAR